MALAITPEHRALAEVADAVLSDHAALSDARRALNRVLDGRPGYWRDACDLGWWGLHVAEAVGGSGQTFAETAIVLERLGRQCAPLDPLATVVATSVAPDRLLPSLCDGSLDAGVALAGQAQRDGTELSGSWPVVVGRDSSALLLLVVGEDVAVVEDLSCCTVAAVDHALDPGLPLVHVTARGARVEELLVGAAPVLRRFAALSAAAIAVGGMQTCLEAAVAYVGVREQFGRPVGSFQAVKHHCANLLVSTELSSAAVWDAARLSDETPESQLATAVAASVALPAFVSAAQQNIQLHGGIGYTWEHDAHLYLRRATALAAVFGPAERAAHAVYDRYAAGVRRSPSVDLPPEAEGFRGEARLFLETWRAAVPEQRQPLAARAGYLVPHWPQPYGRGAGAVEQLVLEEELSELPRQSLGLGEWVLPTILQHGTQEQRDRYLWPSLEGTLRWCQLFSEPGAGSDAAAVATRAHRVEGGWVVNGQKVWTSEAHMCQMGLATVRTDPKATTHAGITAMAIDLSAAGVDVRPLTEITGETLFNEVFLDEVFVPDGDVIGALGGGWKVALSTLANERLSIGANPVTLEAEALLALLSRHACVDDGILREIGGLLAEAQALKALNLRQLERVMSDGPPGVEGNIAKLLAGEHAQRVVNLGARIAGAALVTGAEPEWAHDYLFARCLTIAGGTSEVVRTQIAERILGLPREPRVVREVAS
ncbi:MAG TPA: acyl-CoA dehydrogenase [Mycobacteriales bacterium]|nr:acyl-CoA dehydrogenase [Mycobacteriales bacterium]